MKLEDLDSFSSLIGILFLIVNAILTLICSAIYWTWKASEFKNSIERRELILDNELNLIRSKNIELEKDIGESRIDIIEKLKELRKFLGNNEAEIQHIKNYLVKVSSKKEFDDTFVPVSVRKRED